MLANINNTRMINNLSELRTTLSYLGVVTVDVWENLCLQIQIHFFDFYESPQGAKFEFWNWFAQTFWI